MRRLFQTIICIAVFCANNCFAQELRPVVIQSGMLIYKGEYGDNLICHIQTDTDQQDGKWGYINKKGSLVIPVQFDDADYFSDGFARVRKGDKYGFIDTTGKVVVYYLLDDAKSFDPECGWALVQRSGKWGWINHNGEYRIACRFEAAYPFYRGLAMVKLNGKYGYIDVTGRFRVQCRFDNLSPFGDNGFAMAEQSGKWGFVDTTGAIAIGCKFDGVLPFQEDLAAVKIGSKWGFVDIKGTIVIQPQYDYVESFYKGKALVESDDMLFYINKEGVEEK